jgi:DNA-binding MarR family transcriptional regulator
LVGYLIKQLHHAMRRALDERLRDLGLNTAHYGVLHELNDCDGLSAAELARRSLVRPQAMTPILARLETQGLIERVPHPTHRRILQVRLTPDGRAMFREIERRCAEVEGRFLASLTRVERQALFERLQDCVANIEPWPDPWSVAEKSG